MGLPTTLDAIGTVIRIVHVTAHAINSSIRYAGIATILLVCGDKNRVERT